MWLMVEDCLLGGSQLVHVHGPVSLDNEQRAGADDSVPGRLESLQDWPGVLEQGRGDMGVLGLDGVTVGDVRGSQERLPWLRVRPRRQLVTSLHRGSWAGRSDGNPRRHPGQAATLARLA